jgi:membrane protein
VPLFGFSRLPLKLFAKKIFRRIIDNAVSDRAALLDLVARMAPFVPADALGLVKGHLDDLLHNQHPHLLTLGFAVALWSASRGVDSLRGALNLSYDVKESRPFWKTNGIALGITILTSVLMLLSFAGFALGTAWAWVRWPVVAAMIMTVEALLYYYLPDVDQEFRFITPGSIIGTVLWLLSTWGFTQYVQHFGNYNATYGSIGGVIVLMTWLWISGLIFVLGGEMNALLEHESPEGKAKGARAAGETPPPGAERPRASAPGVVDSADAAERSDERLQERPPTEQLH